MKTSFLFLVSLLFSSFCFAQPGTSTFLTWMKGDSSVDQAGRYGVRGTSHTLNKPGARNFSATWRDNNNNLWLFGGNGLDGKNETGYLNDLWKYDPASNSWTWIKGDSIRDQKAVYGQQGTPHNNNRPGAIYASLSWTDASGNLWLFGGYGYTSNGIGLLNDIWKYDPVINKWVWLKGDKSTNESGQYGTLGVASINNKPGARYGSRTWIDKDGNMWLFGGYGYDSNTQGILNDLWKYNPTTNQWTWINGDNTINQPGVYGEQEISSPLNKPGARYASVCWTDSEDNFWLFGGYGIHDGDESVLNDLWKYDRVANQWTWVNGDSSLDNSGIYGTQGVASSSSKPGARNISVAWTDAAGKFWLFGGYGYDNNNIGYLNDLWEYDPASNQWTWVKGDNQSDQPGVYGTQGMPAVVNKSGARTSNISWTDSQGQLWLFGGFGYDDNSSGLLNDLWKIRNFQVLPVELSYFNGLLNDNATQLYWQTSHELNFSHFIIERSTDGSHFTSIARVDGRKGIETNKYSYVDNELQTIAVPKIFYRLKLVDNDQRYQYSKTILFDRKNEHLSIRVFPNPASNYLNLNFIQDKPGVVSASISDMKGTIVKKQSSIVPAGQASISLDIRSLPPAVYLVTIKTGTMVAKEKFIKQ
jgi:N-acetylneuraminic acid mutarotase